MTGQQDVSVLIPVYNRERLLPECVRSALEQSPPVREVIVSDNASTDATDAVAREIAATETRVRYVRNATNLGPVGNWANAAAFAEATYGKLLFSDDLLLPGAIARSLSLMSSDVGFVFTSVRIGPTLDETSIAYAWRPNDGLWSSREFIEESLVGDRSRVPVSPCAALFRVADIRANLSAAIDVPVDPGFAALGAGPDVLLLLRTAAAYRRVGFVAEPLHFFRVHDGSLTIERRDAVIRGYRAAEAAFVRELGDADLEREVTARIWLGQSRLAGRPLPLSHMRSDFGLSSSATGLARGLVRRARRRLAAGAVR